MTYGDAGLGPTRRNSGRLTLVSAPDGNFQPAVQRREVPLKRTPPVTQRVTDQSGSRPLAAIIATAFARTAMNRP